MFNGEIFNYRKYKVSFIEVISYNVSVIQENTLYTVKSV